MHMYIYMHAPHAHMHWLRGALCVLQVGTLHVHIHALHVHMHMHIPYTYTYLLGAGRHAAWPHAGGMHVHVHALHVHMQVGTLRGHTQEVCGLKWSPSGTQLASGSNDNLLNIWDDRYVAANRFLPPSAHAYSGHDTALHKLDAHRAAVKALAWCPWQRYLLASGGGTSDRCIRFWNTRTGACLDKVDTQSQVCALQWSRIWGQQHQPTHHPLHSPESSAWLGLARLVLARLGLARLGSARLGSAWLG